MVSPRTISPIPCIVITFLLFGISISTGVDIEFHRYDDKLTYESGTEADYLSDPIFYDSYIPLLFEFPVPRHSDKAMKIMWDHASMCNISDSRYDGKLCPVVHHLHKIVSNLSHDMGFWKDIYPSDDDIGEPEKNTQIKCDSISPHFETHFTSKVQLDSYIQSLQRCQLGQFLQQLSPDTKWLIDKRIYYTMIENFYREFYRHLPSTGSVDWVVTLNSYTALQGILLSNNYMESNRIHNAFASCRENKIPHSFITKAILRKALVDMKPKLVESTNFKYMFHEGNNDILSYFRLPLADCTFSDDNELIVRVLIPVRQSDIEYKLVHLIAYPFLESTSNVSTKGEETRICHLRVKEKMKLIESSTGLLFQSHCEPYELCQTSEMSSFAQSDACTASIVSHSDEAKIASKCGLKCFPIENSMLPIFRKISSDTFIIVGGSQFKIFLNCNGQPLEMLRLKDEGALKVVLACDCHVSYRGQIFYPTDPCGSKLEVRHVMPIHWKNVVKNMSDQDGKFDKLLPVEDPENNEIHADKQVFCEHQQGSAAVANGKGMIAHICVLWILLLALIGFIGLLSYQMYKLVKWKEFQVYKDARIVYNVPESPKLNNKF